MSVHVQSIAIWSIHNNTCNIRTYMSRLYFPNTFTLSLSLTFCSSSHSSFSVSFWNSSSPPPSLSPSLPDGRGVIPILFRPLAQALYLWVGVRKGVLATGGWFLLQQTHTHILYSRLFSRGVYFTNFEIAAIHGINFCKINRKPHPHT